MFVLCLQVYLRFELGIFAREKHRETRCRRWGENDFLENYDRPTNQPANRPTDTYRPGGREITPPLLKFWFMESPKMILIIPVPLGQKAQKHPQTRLPPLLVWHLAQQPLLVRLMLRLPTPLLFQMRTTTWERFKTQIFQVDFKSFRIALIVPMDVVVSLLITSSLILSRTRMLRPSVLPTAAIVDRWLVTIILISFLYNCKNDLL